jgi:hypothetical protein
MFVFQTLRFIFRGCARGCCTNHVSDFPCSEKVLLSKYWHGQGMDVDPRRFVHASTMPSLKAIVAYFVIKQISILRLACWNLLFKFMFYCCFVGNSAQIIDMSDGLLKCITLM